MARSVKNRQSIGSRVFDICNILILSLFAFTTLAPFLHILAASLSDKFALINAEVSFWPVKPQLGNYGMVIGNKVFWNSYKITVILIILATAVQMFMTVITAYPLSKKTFRAGSILCSWLFSP